MTRIALDTALWQSREAGSSAYLDRWLVCEGDHVEAGQPLAQACVVHAWVEVLAPHRGRLEQIHVAAGDTFTPGAALGELVPT